MPPAWDAAREERRISSQREAELHSRNIDAAGILALVLPAIVLFAGFIWLGYLVKLHGEPPALWAFAQAVRGHATGVAWVLTNFGFAAVLAPLFFGTLVLGIASPRWRLRALFVLGVALVCWRAADAFQHFFARPRRDDWLIRHEHAFSYPSSHAAICTGFYFLWGLVLLGSSLRGQVRWTAFVLLTALTLGIIWSRLSLAAHYPTDVIGGTALGALVILLATALLRTLGREPFGGRSP